MGRDLPHFAFVKFLLDRCQYQSAVKIFQKIDQLFSSEGPLHVHPVRRQSVHIIQHALPIDFAEMEMYLLHSFRNVHALLKLLKRL